MAFVNCSWCGNLVNSNYAEGPFGGIHWGEPGYIPESHWFCCRRCHEEWEREERKRDRESYPPSEAELLFKRLANEERQGAAPVGSDTKVSIPGYAYYSLSKSVCEINIEKVVNLSAHQTGLLKVIFWLSKAGKYNGGTLDGYQMAESLINKNEGLKQGFEFQNITRSISVTGNPPKGSYWPVITINEKCVDGKWYIVGWCNYKNPEIWS